MATIGLDKLYYAKITEAVDGTETYGTPVSLAKAMKADLSVELAEATLYADDGPAEIVKEFKTDTDVVYITATFYATCTPSGLPCRWVPRRTPRALRVRYEMPLLKTRTSWRCMMCRVRARMWF